MENVQPSRFSLSSSLAGAAASDGDDMEVFALPNQQLLAVGGLLVAADVLDQRFGFGIFVGDLQLLEVGGCFEAGILRHPKEVFRGDFQVPVIARRHRHLEEAARQALEIDRHRSPALAFFSPALASGFSSVAFSGSDGLAFRLRRRSSPSFRPSFRPAFRAAVHPSARTATAGLWSRRRA